MIGGGAGGRAKIMGAGVAASPHCPATGDARPGRRGGPPWAVSRSGLSRGLGPILRGLFEAQALLRGSPRLPVRAEALAVRLGRSGTEVPFPAVPVPKAEASVPFRQEPSAEAWGLPGSPWTGVLGLPIRSSRAETRSCPTEAGPKPFSAGGSARLASATAGQVLSRSPCPCLCGPGIRRSSEPWALYETCRFRIR